MDELNVVPNEEDGGNISNARKRTADEIEDDTPTQPNKIQKVEHNSSKNAIQCSSCMKTITTQTIGKPDKCEHEFCLSCLLEKSRRSYQCPVDKIMFENIFFRNQAHGEVEGSMSVADFAPRHEMFNYRPRRPVCSICGEGNRPGNEEGALVEQCDGCGRNFHSTCADPNDEGYDAFYWFCRECQLTRPRPQNVPVREQAEDSGSESD